MSGPSFSNMVLEVLTALQKEFAAHIIKISSWTTLKMEAAGSSETLVNLQIGVVSYPRRPIYSIFSNFFYCVMALCTVSVVNAAAIMGYALKVQAACFSRILCPAKRLHFINPEHHIMNIYCCENS